MPHIVLLSGGTACRSINLALCHHAAKLTRIVPASDSGGSSKVIRETLGILPVGDIRQALMTMAHGEGRAGEVVRLCNARLSDMAEPAGAAREFAFYVSGDHPFIRAMDTALGSAITEYLRLFAEQAGPDFDLRNGSIGNFILTGAYLAHDRDINAAIGVFRRLCGISGNVWPVTTRNDMELCALLSNGRRIDGQHRITRLAGDDAPIASLLVRAGGEVPDANPAAVEAIGTADAIVFGPGSFFTSILPHVIVTGIARAVADNWRARKLFIANILEDAETADRPLAGLIGVFLDTCRAKAGDGVFVDTAVVNRDPFPFERSARGYRYLRTGSLDGIETIAGDFEDAWDRGRHDGEAVAALIMRVAVS